MVILDTNALIFDALAPKRLSPTARQAIEQAQSMLCCCDISLWEVAMLISKGRLDPGTDTLSFLKLIVAARSLQLLPIVPEIANLAILLDVINPDPADRIIVATAAHHDATLITRDKNLRAARLPMRVIR